jgi:glutamine---fructose-6-phosphate transaminase (isomerizing)
VHEQAHHLFPLPENLPEMFSPLLSAIPGSLFAAYRAAVLDEPFFRNFEGGRNPEGGGGISRIRTSQMNCFDLFF